MRGILITFEGIDGSGKSTQAELLRGFLSSRGFRVILLREPGGTAIGELIRSILLDRRHDDMSPYTEVFLYLAARAQITFQLISPALDRGEIVVLDRFIDSTTVYQGYARGLGVEEMNRLNTLATSGVFPDVTFVIDCDPAVALSRVSGSPDRLESKGMEFMGKVREGFLELCGSGEDRFVLLDGSRDIESIQEEIRSVVERLLESHSF